MGLAALDNQRKSMANHVYTAASHYCLKSMQTVTAKQDCSVIVGEARVQSLYQAVEDQHLAGRIIVFQKHADLREIIAALFCAGYRHN